MPYIMKKTGGKYPLFSDGSGGFNQPWKEVPEPPSPFLLDTVGDAYIAVSMRKLKSDATLAFQAFRPDNGTFQDIGFSGDYVDLNALYTFTGTFSSYVSKWYDQSGGGRDLIALDYDDQNNSFCTPTQSGTNNVNCWGPRIIHNGIVASQSAMIGPDFKYTGFTASSALKYKQTYGATQTFYFGVFYRNSGSGTPVIVDRDNLTSGNRQLFYWPTNNGTNYDIWNPSTIMSGSNFTAINNKVNYSLRFKANNHQIYWNSSSGSNTNTNLVAGYNNSGGFTLGQIQGFVNGGDLINQTYGFRGIISEQLIWERNLSDGEMTTIQDNQETYYSI